MEGKSGVPCLLDVSRLVWRAWRGQFPTGIDRACLAYVKHYGARARAVVQWGNLTRVLSARGSQQLFARLLEPGQQGMKGDLFRLACHALFQLEQDDVRDLLYLNVGHTGLDRAGHARWIKRVGVLPVYFVHDLIPLTHAEYCRAAEPQRHFKRMTALLQNAAGIVGNSCDTVKKLATFAGLQNVLPMPPTLVASLGAEPANRLIGDPLPASLPTRPYFVLLGTIEGRKNHLLMLTIWADLARRLGSASPQLVIIGQRGWESEQACDMLDRSEAIRGHVIELPRCDDVMLNAYLRGARALLFPSFVEGYGLPLVEALACGTPVLASDLAVFRELAGDIPDYLSPIDGLGWARAIEDYAQVDSAARAAQIDRMQGWTAPSWEDHFAKVDHWLEGLAATPPR